MAEFKEKQLLSVKEVSTVLSIGVTTVWCHVKNGHIPAPIKIGGATRWRRSDIEAIFASPEVE